MIGSAFDARRLQRRVGQLPPRRARIVTGQSTTAPLLRDSAGTLEAWLQLHLPGGAAMAVRVGPGAPLVRLAAIATGVAMAGGAVAAALGLRIEAAMLLLPPLALGAMHWGSKVMARRRRAAFERGFPDAVATMIRALHAGLPITAAIAEVARGTGPVAQSFGRIGEAMYLGQPLEPALWAVARGVGLAEFDFFAVTVALQRETGGNLAETLGGLDATLRMRRQRALKVKAMAAEARASSMIIGSLPFVMALLLWLSSPAYLVPLFTTTMGKAMLAAGLTSIAVGAGVIGALTRVKA